MSAPTEPTAAGRPPGPALTISASYGAGGSVIGPRVAQLLGLPFIDRIISAQLSEDAARAEAEDPASRTPDDGQPTGPGGGAPSEGLAEGEAVSRPASRFLSYFARAASVGSVLAPDVVIDDDETLRQRSEAVLADIVAGRPGVVLGHAGAMCLASRQRAYHVRLDGPEQRRVQRAMGLEHLDEQRALRRQAETDRARSLFIRRLYRASWTDPRWYHLVIDSTVLTLESTAQLVVSAAQAFWDAQP